MHTSDKTVVGHGSQEPKPAGAEDLETDATLASGSPQEAPPPRVIRSQSQPMTTPRSSGSTVRTT